MKIALKATLVGVYLLLNAMGFAQSSDIIIGKQTWKSENLNVNTFRNGDIIKQAKTNRRWKKLAQKSEPAWCYYEKKTANGKVYGKLYNWYAVSDMRGLAPEGWHIPDEMDWIQLTEYLGGEDISGEKMKTVKGWREHVNKHSNGVNTSNFTGLPGGYRLSNGIFFYAGSFGYWWTANADNVDLNNAFYRDLSYNKSNLGKGTNDKRNGLSVRCIKD